MLVELSDHRTYGISSYESKHDLIANSSTAGSYLGNYSDLWKNRSTFTEQVTTRSHRIGAQSNITEQDLVAIELLYYRI